MDCRVKRGNDSEGFPKHVLERHSKSAMHGGGGGGSGLAAPRWAVPFMVAALAALALIKFTGLADHFAWTLINLREPGFYANDLFAGNTVFVHGSVYYALFNALGIAAERDAVALAVHLAFSAVAVAFAFLAVRRFYGVGDGATALLVVLLSCFLFFKLVVTQRPEVIGHVSASPTAIGQSLSFVALYLLLARRFALAALALTAVLAFTAKGNAILLPVAALYILILGEAPRRTLLWLVIPAAYVAVEAIGSPIAGLSRDALVRLAEMAIEREAEEAAFHLQPVAALVLFAASFAVYPWVVRRFEDAGLRALAWAVYWTTLAVFVGGFLYTLGAYRLVPVPALILLGPPRATSFYTYLLFSMGFVILLRSEALRWYEKAAAAFAMVALNASAAGIVQALAVAALGIGLPRAFRAVAGRDVTALPGLAAIARRVGAWPMTALLPPLLLLFVIVRIPASYSFADPRHFDTAAYPYIGMWTAGVFADDATWRAYRHLADDPDDYVLVALYRPTQSRAGRYGLRNELNRAALKSRFADDLAYHYFDAARWDEAKRRKAVARALLADLDAGRPVAADTVEFLAARRVRVMTPAALDSLFPAAAERRHVDGFVLITF